jgi:hypothetical protein
MSNNNDSLWPTILTLAVVFAIGYIGGEISDANEPERVNTTSSAKFDYFVLDGMPCAIQERTKAVALSCDWDLWNGKIEDGEITFPHQITFVPVSTPTATHGKVDCIEGEWDVLESRYVTCEEELSTWDGLNAPQD